MYFRFVIALVLVVGISLAGTALEKRTLQLKRAVSRQHYRLELLEARFASQRVLAQQLGAPSRLVDQVDQEFLAPPQPEKPAASPGKGPRKKRHAPSSRKARSH